MQKEEFYKQVKIWGMISFIPLMLAAGPVAGYLAGDYLKNKFGSDYILFICVFIGFVVAIAEVIRIIKLVTKIAK